MTNIKAVGVIILSVVVIAGGVTAAVYFASGGDKATNSETVQPPSASSAPNEAEAEISNNDSQQVGQRDTARKSDVSAVLYAIDQYTANNRGSMPGSGDQLSEYISDLSAQTSTIEIVPSSVSDLVQVPEGQISVYVGYACGESSVSGQSLSASSSRKVAAVTKLEAGSYHCSNN